MKWIFFFKITKCLSCKEVKNACLLARTKGGVFVSVPFSANSGAAAAPGGTACPEPHGPSDCEKEPRRAERSRAERAARAAPAPPAHTFLCQPACQLLQMQRF